MTYFWWRVECPYCRQILEKKVEDLGTTVQCPCGKWWWGPSPPPVHQDSPEPTEDVGKEPEKPKERMGKKPRKSKKKKE